MTLNKLLKNCAVIILAATVSFVIHLSVNNALNVSIGLNDLAYAYVVNIFLACAVVIILFFFQKKLQNQLGFIFMASSLLKFALFFFLFYPEYNADGNLSRLEFLTFFIPYVVCLIAETVILAKFLNSLDDFYS